VRAPWRGGGGGVRGFQVTGAGDAKHFFCLEIHDFGIFSGKKILASIFLVACKKDYSRSVKVFFAIV